MATSTGFISLTGFPEPGILEHYYAFFNPEKVQVPMMKMLLENSNKEGLEKCLPQYHKFQNMLPQTLNEWKVVVGGLLFQINSNAMNTGCQDTIDMARECISFYIAYINTGNRRNLAEERRVWFQYERMIGFLEQSISVENSKRMAIFATPTLPRLADGAFGFQNGVLGSTALTPTDQTPSPIGQLCGWPSPTPSFQSTSNFFFGSAIFPNNNAVPITPGFFPGSAPNLLLTLMPQNYHFNAVLQHSHTSKAVPTKNSTEIQSYKSQPYKRKKMEKVFIFDSWKTKQIPIGIQELSNNASALKALVNCFNSFRTYHSLPVEYMSAVTEVPQRKLNPFFNAFQSGTEDWQAVKLHFKKVATWIYSCHQFDEEVPGLEKAGNALELKFKHQLLTKCTPKKKRELVPDLLNLEQMIRHIEKRETYQPFATEILALTHRIQCI